MGRAIIFVDEIDSIGRKRGAGLGGGHDEREQTLNQMLSEMDGFEATEGIVMMAATNRPDILDPALLRPGRFDRQVVVPLPELDERLRHPRGPLQGQAHRRRRRPRRRGPGHARHERRRPGQPRQRGRAVRRARGRRRGPHARTSRQARDRVLMGQRRESMALSDDEKELTAYHEAGHAVLRRRAPPRRPAPQGDDPPDRHGPRRHPAAAREERHIYRPGLHRGLASSCAMGGRIAEELVFGVVSTGANNDLVSVHRAGPQDGARVGHVRAASARWRGARRAQVFLGEDLMHTRDYSDETARVIDEEVERILREQEERCRDDAAPSTATASTSWPARCSSTRRSTAPRSTASSSWAGPAPRPPRSSASAADGPPARNGGRQHPEP